jgi:hypothetical protein
LAAARCTAALVAFSKRFRLGLLGLTTLWTGCGPCAAPLQRPDDFSAAAAGVSEEVRAVLQKKLALVEGLAADPMVRDAVRRANHDNRDLSMDEILRRDEKWQKTSGLDDFIKSFITNACGQFLVSFQEQHGEFAEIFVTDQRGLIVAETNKTSDYLQSDEAWWVEAFADGRGKSYQGEVEYDESSMSEAISVYVPVLDPQTKRAIGVVKAVCDITAIKMEL